MTKEEEFIAFLDERIVNGSLIAWAAYTIVKRQFLKIYEIKENVPETREDKINKMAEFHANKNPPI